MVNRSIYLFDSEFWKGIKLSVNYVYYYDKKYLLLFKKIDLIMKFNLELQFQGTGWLFLKNKKLLAVFSSMHAFSTKLLIREWYTFSTQSSKF